MQLNEYPIYYSDDCVQGQNEKQRVTSNKLDNVSKNKSKKLLDTFV